MATGTIKKGLEFKTVVADEATINANSTKWISIPTPTGCYVHGAVGYYLNGDNATLCNVYAVWQNNGAVSFALRNLGTAQAKVTVSAILIVNAT